VPFCATNGDGDEARGDDSMKESMDLHDRILERLQTKGDTEAETLAEELKESLTAVLVCLDDLRKQGFIDDTHGVWSARLPG
jgi:predicted ArsR family transcriptional regulator